ncbi:hypothetical protein SNE40_008077 [Patella caerulea]|uniref:C2H2-type domain-containing protein n=1 Tax=Patella caerulea TaxID=87958 RepID=A0AAN8JZA8_PATCE
MADKDVKYVDITLTEEELNIKVNNNISCDVEGCNKTFTSGGSYLLHKTKTHPAEGQVASLPKKKTSDVVYRYHCPVFNCVYNPQSERFFSSQKYLKQHYGKVHGEKKYLCGTCQKGFAFDRDLKRHRETCGVTFKCVTCGCPFTSPEAVLTHCKRKQHQAPDSARSSKRGLKKLEKDKTSAEVKAVSPNPYIIIINQTNKPLTVPNSIPISKSNLSELPLIMPKHQYSSSVLVPGNCNSNIKSLNIKNFPQISSNKNKVDFYSHDKIRNQDGNISESSAINLCSASTSASRLNSFSLEPRISKIMPLQQTVAGIQTDIYGVGTLCFDSNDAYPNFGSISFASTGTQSDIANATAAETSTTGIQTSVSFLPSKKKDCSIAGTQTPNENILDKALKSAQIPTQSPMCQSFKRSRKTSEVQTSGVFSTKKKRRKSKNTHHATTGTDSLLPSHFQMSFDDFSSNWTQTNLSTFQPRQDSNLLQNMETQTCRLSPQPSVVSMDPVLPRNESCSSFLSELESRPCKNKILKGNLDLLADTTLMNFLPMEVTDLDIVGSDDDNSRNGQRHYSLGDPALAGAFSSSIDSESQTVTSASDLDLLLHAVNQPVTVGQGTDTQTQTAEDELLDFLMTNMETQTTEDCLFPGFGLSDIETQTSLTPGISGENSVGYNQAQIERGMLMCSTSTSPDTSFLLESLVTTETQTNPQSFNDPDFTVLTDMETQTTFNTLDFYTNLTDSHTQTSFY